MVIVLKKGTSKKNLIILIKKVFESNKSQGIDTSKYNGRIKFSIDPLKLHKRMRDEWE